jgi:hypothetical protein
LESNAGERKKGDKNMKALMMRKKGLSPSSLKGPACLY